VVHTHPSQPPLPTTHQSSYELLLLHPNEDEDEDDWTVDNETSAYLLVYSSSEGLEGGTGDSCELNGTLQRAVDAANCEYCIDYLLGDL